MTEEIEKQYEFDESFEEQLMARLVRDKVFFFKYHGLVKIGYFIDEVWNDLFRILEEYYSQYHDAITIEILRNEIKKLLVSTSKKKSKEGDENEAKFYDDKLIRILAIDLTQGEAYTIEQVVQFARRRELKRTIKADYGNIESLDFNFDKYVAKINDAKSIGAEIDVGYDYFAETIPRTARVRDFLENKVSTGFKELNRALDGGLGPGDLGIVVGPPSRGKTAMEVNLAVGALRNRKNVLYVGFEGSLDELNIRFDMCIARCTKEMLYKQTEKVRDDVLTFIKYLKKKLIIKMYPAESVTVQDIDNFITYLELTTGFIPDVIIIDPLYLCKSTNARDDTWKGRNYAEGKALADRRRKPVWSSVQAKYASLDSDVISPRDISEATIRIWAIMDVMIGLCQTEEEKNLIPQQMRIFLGKNRNKEAQWVIPVVFNKHQMLITEVEV